MGVSDNHASSGLSNEGLSSYLERLKEISIPSKLVDGHDQYLQQ